MLDIANRTFIWYVEKLRKCFYFEFKVYSEQCMDWLSDPDAQGDNEVTLADLVKAYCLPPLPENKEHYEDSIWQVQVCSQRADDILRWVLIFGLERVGDKRADQVAALDWWKSEGKYCVADDEQIESWHNTEKEAKIACKLKVADLFTDLTYEITCAFTTYKVGPTFFLLNPMEQLGYLIAARLEGLVIENFVKE